MKTTTKPLSSSAKNLLNNNEKQFSAALLNMLEDVNLIKKQLEEKNAQLEETNRKLIDTQTALLNMTEDLQKTNNLLREEKEKINAVLREIGEGVIVVNPDRKINMWNKAAENITGFTEKEVKGKFIWDVLITLDKNKNKITEKRCPFLLSAKLKKVITINELYLTRKDGKLVPIADGVAAIFDDQGNLVNSVFVFKDVSKEKAIEQAKDEFLSIASHQLRTPMTAIKGYLSILMSGKVGKMSPKAMEFLQEMNRANERLVKLVADTLDVSRIEQERLDMKIIPFDINKLIKEDIEELKALADKKNLKLIRKIPSQPLPYALGDPKYVKQVLDNLIGNAIKYTEKGKIEVWAEAKDGFIITHVKDAGVGIDTESQGKIFQKFFRAVTTSDIGGTGLGLYISKRLIEAMKGKIWFTSQVGKGSTFSFSLPVANSQKSKVKS